MDEMQENNVPRTPTNKKMGHKLQSLAASLETKVSGAEVYLEKKSAPRPRKPKQEISHQETPRMGLKQLRTYDDDIAETMRTRDESLVSIAVKEQKRAVARGTQKSPFRTSPAFNKTMLTLSALVLFALGGGFLYYGFNFYEEKTSVQETFDTNALIFPDKETEIPLDTSQETTLEAIRAIVGRRALQPGSIMHLYVTKTNNLGARELIATRELFSLFAKNTSSPLVRALDDSYMLGIHALDGNQAFLIIRVDAFDKAFAGMLDWEPYMPQDIDRLLGTSLKTITNTKQSETETGTNISVFEDVIIENHDARVITNNIGRGVLLYTFLDRSTLIITTNEITLTEIIKRLTSSQFVR